MRSLLPRWWLASAPRRPLLLPRQVLAGLLLLIGPFASAQSATADPDSSEPSLREKARTSAQSDSDFLRQLETGQPPSEAPASPSSAPQFAPPAVSQTVPDEPPRRSEPSAPSPSAAASGRAAIRFVEEFIAASTQPTPEEELSFYAPRVRYFDSGVVSHETIEKDQRRYYHRWPVREFTLREAPRILRQDGDTLTLRYRLSYQLRRGEETATGQTEHLLELRNGPDGLKIESIRERKAAPPEH